MLACVWFWESRHQRDGRLSFHVRVNMRYVGLLNAQVCACFVDLASAHGQDRSHVSIITTPSVRFPYIGSISCLFPYVLPKFNALCSAQTFFQNSRFLKRLDALVLHFRVIFVEFYFAKITKDSMMRSWVLLFRKRNSSWHFWYCTAREVPETCRQSSPTASKTRCFKASSWPKFRYF